MSGTLLGRQSAAGAGEEVGVEENFGVGGLRLGDLRDLACERARHHDDKTGFAAARSSGPESFMP